MDPIDRQDVIDAIERTDWYHINKNGELVHGANSNDDVPLYKADDIYKAINGLPSAQRWIPCSEKLPENEDVVIVTYADGITGLNLYRLDSGKFLGYMKVVAWMPLPEPYCGALMDGVTSGD